MRIGIFGGSFDPVHYGHLLLAETCREQCRLDQVWFVPASVPPHKARRQLAPAKARLEMLQLAIAGHEAFHVSTIELDRGGISYTVDTLSDIKQQHPDAELFLLMGDDSLRDLPTWRSPKQICQLATPVVVRRAGSPEPDLPVVAGLVSHEQMTAIRNCQVTMPLVELASTDIRQRVSEGRSIRFRTPRAVEKYIETHWLYRENASASEE